ncbi:MAG: copper amine oxidase N-terminal domain-containing protein [Clostridiales bacterium]|nr:copper amine oxidase N-terminal domain-containing protein [Clostridiales bacterium]
MGATVEWNDNTKTDVVTLNGKTFTIKPGEPLPNGMGEAAL